MNEHLTRRIRKISAIILLLFGLIGLLVAFGAPWVGGDLTPGFGALQMLFLMIGLTCLTAAGFLLLNLLRPVGAPRSLQADVGARLAATGLVFAYVAGFADLLGIGTHPHANYPRPFMGWLQISGIVLGLCSIVLGMILYHTSRGNRPASSLQFLLDKEETEES
jgi:hypothetical protein